MELADGADGCVEDSCRGYDYFAGETGGAVEHGAGAGGDGY